MSTLKERKEAFVSDLTGGSVFEIYKVTSVTLVSYAYYLALRDKKVINENSIFAQIADFYLNWILLLLSVTVYSSNTERLVISLIPLLFLLFLCNPSSNDEKTNITRKQKIVKVNLKDLTLKEYLPYKAFITVYRSQMMVITCIAILAVDFKTFPRRFAKVENWGTSLMDLGVGSFVFSMGLVSCRNILKKNFQNEKTNGIIKLFQKSIWDTIPVLILGIIRLISVKLIGYQEHESEYGTHWNFFFTLGLLPSFVTLISPLTKIIPKFYLSIIIGLVYELTLINTELLKYILVAPRVDLISSNKEGIFSFIGYLAIFLSGQSCGHYVLPSILTLKNFHGKEITKNDILKTKNTNSIFTVSPVKGLLISTIIYHSLYYVINVCYTYSVSRKLANFLYILWVCAYNTTFLLGYLYVSNFFCKDDYKFEYIAGNDDIVSNDHEEIETAIEKIYFKKTPKSLHSVNANSLLIFLVSNLLTGAVNMTINTLDCNNYYAILILIIYCSTLSVLANFLYKFNIIIKL
ncbi:hypothetical protein PACTADRAFT_3862 [Pachysolen tannophilus NRRL Y-2460]|uniref:GPI-anchored wall transfer protein n=1 Tax=Pachysolen tannophilus NRRL Y-2460 TaxID=669874 RepID=A0A1E4TTA5_PACTA|nr:hypothetical protein PACTADRAFT_3862 [Pachysolen tannophilus NRRL Y-2460]